jgi:hypothetical protein
LRLENVGLVEQIVVAECGDRNLDLGKATRGILAGTS